MSAHQGCGRGSIERWMYLVALLHLLWTISGGLAAIGNTVTDEDAANWRLIVEEHLCPLIECEKWCDCSQVSPRLSPPMIGKTTSPQCDNSTYSTAGTKLVNYTDCAKLESRSCFKWKPLGRPKDMPNTACEPTNSVLTCLEWVVRASGDLVWEVCLEDNSCVPVTELCDAAPPVDSCDLCERPTTPTLPHVSTRRIPGNAGATSRAPRPGGLDRVSLTPGPGMTVSSNSTDGGTALFSNHVTYFIVGVGVGVGVVILALICVCCLVIYMRRKRGRTVHQQQQQNNRDRDSYPAVDGNQYSTIERPSHLRMNGEGSVLFTISPQTSVDSSSSPGTKKKSKRKDKKSVVSLQNASPTKSPYTEYYPDRAPSCYAGLQPVGSDSALLLRNRPESLASPFNIFAEYQEPDQVMPKTFTPFCYDGGRMSASTSHNSFKLTGEYIDPEDINGPGWKKRHSVDIVDKEKGGSRGVSPEATLCRQFKHKGDDITTSPTSSMLHGIRKGKQKQAISASCRYSANSRQNLGSPDGKEGTLYNELVDTLNKKRAVTKSESSPLEIETENPYAEVGDIFLQSNVDSNEDFPIGGPRQRSYSQPMGSTLPGYRTYEEIKPSLRGNNRDNLDTRAPSDTDPKYCVLEDSTPPTACLYYQLEDPKEDTSSTQHYFELEKPSSLPLDAKKKKHLQNGEHNNKMATLYQNDKCAAKGTGFRNQHFDLCVDSDNDTCHLNGVTAKAPAYFQLEKSRERSSLGSAIQEHMGSSETVFANDPNSRAEGSLTFYPGGRKRSSTYSLEEQAYDRLNRSARSSRASTRRSNGPVVASSDPHAAYAVLSPSEEYDLLAKAAPTKSKGLWKK